MQLLMSRLAKKIIPSRYHEVIARTLYGTQQDFSVKSFSQEGEDLILRRLFEEKKNGFYVDVGAHHPQRFSNTYLFYELGWSGINIDPLPGSMTLFNELRPRDINLEIGVSDSDDELAYYVFKEPALNTFSKELAESRKSRNCGFVREERVKVCPLSRVLDEHLSSGQKIDFLSIDVEGLDINVLKSNAWDRYRPDVILVECLGFDLSKPEISEVYRYLTPLGWKVTAKTMNTVFFRFGI